MLLAPECPHCSTALLEGDTEWCCEDRRDDVLVYRSIAIPPWWPSPPADAPVMQDYISQRAARRHHPRKDEASS